MAALHWAIPITAALAYVLLRRVSTEHARTALTTTAGLGIAATLIFLPLLLTRS